jgi:hypothetical protein
VILFILTEITAGRGRNGTKNDELIRRCVVVIRSDEEIFGADGDRVPVDIGQRLWGPYQVNPEDPDRPEK